MQVATPVDTPKVVYYNGTQPFPIMSTEDDTFNALRRIPFAEMRAKVSRARAEQMLHRIQVDFAGIFRNSGWTYEEYEQAREESIKCYKAHLYDSGESYKIVHASPYPEPTYWK